MTADPYQVGQYAHVPTPGDVELPDFHTWSANGPSYARCWIDSEGGEDRIALRIRDAYRAMDQCRPRYVMRLEIYTVVESLHRSGKGLPRWVVEAAAYAAGLGDWVEKQEEIERSIGIDSGAIRRGETYGSVERHTHLEPSKASTLKHRRGVPSIRARTIARAENWHLFDQAAASGDPGAWQGGTWVRQLIYSEVDGWFEGPGGIDGVASKIAERMLWAKGGLPGPQTRRDLFALLMRLPLHSPQNVPTRHMMVALAAALCLLDKHGSPRVLPLGGIEKRTEFMQAAKLLALHEGRGALAKLSRADFSPSRNTLPEWMAKPWFRAAVREYASGQVQNITDLGGA